MEAVAKKNRKPFPYRELYLYICTIKNCMERIIAKSTLRKFWEQHPEVELYLRTWYATAMNADWKSPSDVKRTYASASILKNSRVVFNIKGNAYRLIVRFNYIKQWGFIRFIGTHEECNNIDANNI